MAAKTFQPVALERETRSALPTSEAAFHLNRAQQTMRLWAMREDDLVQKAAATIAPLIATAKEKAASTQLHKAALIPDQHAQEFRGVWRGMSDEQQNNLLNTAMKAHDGATVAALTEAPAILSGLIKGPWPLLVGLMYLDDTPLV